MNLTVVSIWTLLGRVDQVFGKSCAIVVWLTFVIMCHHVRLALGVVVSYVDTVEPPVESS